MEQGEDPGDVGLLAAADWLKLQALESAHDLSAGTPELVTVRLLRGMSAYEELVPSMLQDAVLTARRKGITWDTIGQVMGMPTTTAYTRWRALEPRARRVTKPGLDGPSLGL
jgi:hypothetical protein